MATYCIYKLTNMITLMAYVGITETDRFDDRMGEHKRKKNDTLISKAINKYGWENFKVEILIDNVGEKDLDENYYIECENTRAPHGYNYQRGDGSGAVFYIKRRKKWRARGPGPDYKFVGLYFTKKKADKALDLFLRTGKRMKSDIKTRKKGTGSIRVTKSGRFQARFTVKGKRKCKTVDTEDECEVFFKKLKPTV